MSASEKLRRLEDEQGAFVWGADGETKDPDGILPALIAVVEAAEEFNFPAVRGEAWRNLTAALAALDEALGEP
jgi:predicted phage gp36 major capsid-like protein